jgi:dipeptidyl aminopeptidase/acylaminoacyl peptidase
MNQIMTISIRSIPLFIVYILAVSFSTAQERVLTPGDIVNITGVHSPSISPDGMSVVFVANKQRVEDVGDLLRDLWIVDAEGTTQRRFTWNAKNDWAPSWSPDGAWIAFLSNRDGNTQIYRIPVNGGEAEKITSAPTSVRSFLWSPNGTGIAFTAQDPTPQNVETAHKASHDWKAIDQDSRAIRLHLVVPENKQTRVISYSDQSIWYFAWSPDGNRLVTVATELPTIDASYYGDLYFVDSSGGRLELFAEAPGKTGSVEWSPDGRNIAVRNARAEGKEPINGGVLIFPVAGGDPRSILEDFSGTVVDFGWYSNNEIYFTAQQDTRTTINTVDIRNRRVTTIIDIGAVFTSVTVTPDRRYFAVAGNTVRHPNEIWHGAFREREITKITAMNPELENISLGEVSEVSWRGPDNLVIQGVLIKPVGYVQGTLYPLIVQIHGGPESAYLREWHGSWARWGQLLAGAGYAVLLPNYRGSTSRGVDFIMANMGDMMGKEWEDILAGIDLLIQQGIADPNRIGIGGWSYGGYTSAWAAARSSERIRAAIMGAGISNWISFGGMTDIPHEMARAHWNGYMWDNKELQWDRSPLKYIDGNDAPTLILFGEKDARVPPGQGWELYNALRYYGVDTEFVLYPRAGHSITEREHQLDLLNRVIDWFDRYVK